MRGIIGAYERISLDGEGEGLGVARQHRDNTKLAELRGWSIAEHYTDNNISAFKTDVTRPAFERMLEDLESGVIDGIVAYDLDRVVRQPSDLERIVRIYEKRKGLLFATVQGSINLSTPDGLTMARVMVAFANKSSMDTSRRQKRKNIERAEAGLPHGSRRPFGYNQDNLTLHPTEAPILKEMGHRFLAGESYRDIAEWLELEGHKTTMGKQWFPITVRNTLRRPRYGGIRVHEGVTYEGIWEPVFSRDEWESIQYLIKHRREAAGNRPAAIRYLLTGFAVCGACGGFLNGETKRDAPHKPLRRTYQCKHCHGVTRNADALDHMMRELICYRLDTADLATLIDRGDSAGNVGDLLSKRDALAIRRKAALEDYADGTLTKTDLTVVQRRIDDQLESLEREISAIQRKRLNVQMDVGETVRSAWMERSDGWRRSLVDLLVERVVVNVGKTKPFYDIDGKRARFDPALIEVVWKV